MIICEPQCIGFVHANVNAAYIRLYSNAFPNDEIMFFGEAGHIQRVRDQLSHHSTNIKYIQIDIPSYRQSFINRIIADFKNVASIFKIAKNNKSNILLLSITSSTLLATKIFGLFVGRNIYIVVHGVLEKILEKPKRIMERVLWFKYYLICFNLRNIKYILLGKFIENNALNAMPKLRSYTCALPLPYDLSKPIIGEFQKSSKIVFASAGVATIAKGSHLFFNLAKDVLQENNISNVEFCYIGQFLDDGMNRFVNNCVVLPSKSAPLKHAVYQKYLMGVNFLVFFYPSDSYKLTFSGVFLDAVKFEIPIIAIRNEFFTYYFDKYGKLGWLCDSYQEVIDLVVNLSMFMNADELEEISRNFNHIKSELSVDSQTDMLKSLIN